VRNAELELPSRYLARSGRDSESSEIGAVGANSSVNGLLEDYWHFLHYAASLATLIPSLTSRRTAAKPSR
jgi:hypothetical protein